MKTSKNQLYALMALTFTLLLSCSKEKKDQQSPVTTTDRITSTSWELSRIENEGYHNDSLISRKLEFPAAQVDFRSSGLVLATLPGEPTDSAYWFLRNDSLILDEVKHEIILLDDSEFIFRHSETDTLSNGDLSHFHITFNLEKKP